MENGELLELLEGFEAVWQRVSPPTEATEPPEAPRMCPEPQNGRVPRWFCEI